MERPNWFDRTFAVAKGQSADDVLREIAGNDRVIAAVKEAITQADANEKKPGWVGPSRSQVIRAALASVVNAD